MSEYTNHCKTSVKGNSGQKSTFTETDQRTLIKTVSKNRRTTAAHMAAELNIRLDDHFHENCLTGAS
jgi:hypothetical protein